MEIYDIVSLGKDYFGENLGFLECWGIEASIEAETPVQALLKFYTEKDLRYPVTDLFKDHINYLPFVKDSEEFLEFQRTHIFVDDNEYEVEHKRKLNNKS